MKAVPFRRRAWGRELKGAWSILWTLCLALALSAPAFAQAEIFLLGHGATVAFSHSILFQMGFTLSGEPDVSRVASITLTWGVEGAEANSVSIDLARHVTQEPWGLNVIYPFAPGDPAELPPSMALVPYTWVVTLADGARAILDGELFYADPRFDWETTANDWLTLYTYSSGLSTSRLLESLQPVYDLVSQQTNVASTFRVVLYEPGDGYCPPTVDLTLSAITTLEPEQTPTPTPLPPCDPEVIAKTYHDAGIIPVLRRNANLLELQNVLANSMAKAAWRDVWDAAEVPGWFAEGLAQLYELAPHASAVSLAQNAVRAGTAYGGSELRLAPTTAPRARNRDPWYAQSVAMMLYLVDGYGTEAPARIARAVQQHATFDEALIAVTARDTAEHLVHWRTWVLSDAAQIGNTWTPYLPPSATPTLTRTPTPTLTPSLTRTPTLTAVPTRFGIPVQTPIPVTPTHIPTPRPPTNTPRPPATATRTPAPSEGGGGGLCPGAVALGLLPLVALIVRVRHRD